MKKYRKGVLSAVAALAISSSMLNADYMPLSTSANDDSWVLFGVNGYFGASSTSGISGAFTIDEVDANRWVDNDNDALTAVGSLTDPTANLSSSWGQLDVVDQSYDVEVRVDVSGLGTPDPTDPVRRMYVQDINGNIIFSFTYRASLESDGKSLEFQATTGGTTQDVYEVALQSGATYDDPVAVTSADLAGGGVSTNTDSFNSLVPSDATKHMFDYNISNNPADPSKYAAEYNDVKDANDTLSIYGYDASNGTWLYFDSRNTPGASYNDFETLDKGKAYWAKLDADGDSAADRTNDDSQVAGFVLGSEAVSATDFSGKLYEGWNLISFGDTNTEIRRSTTGLLVDLNTTGSASIKLYDSMLNQSVTVSFDTNASDIVAAQNINYAISKGKVDGTIHRVFELKAYPTDTNGTLALLSNKKFGIEDTNGTIINNIATMSGSTDDDIWVDTNNTSAGQSTNPASGSVYTSAYDEYFLLVEPMVGGTSAETVGTAKVNVVTHNSDGTVDANQLVTIDSNITTATSALNAITNTIEVDVDQDGTNDYALMSSTNPFYLRDFTIARVYDFDATGTTTGEVKAIGLGATYSDLNITIPDTNATDAAATINGNYGLAATADSADNIVVISSDGNSSANPIKSSVNFAVSYVSGDNKLKVTNTSGSVVSSSDDYVKGAIGSVFDLNRFVAAPSNNVLTLDLNTTTLPDGVDNNYSVSVTNMYNVTFNDINVSNPADLDGLVSGINTLLSDLNITSTAAKHSNNQDIVITGTDLINATISTDVNATLTGVAGTVTAGRGYAKVSSITGITSDLKYNSVYSPNYVLDGPLYTINDAGFKLSALVSGTTQMSDGTVNWESIDLTRNTSEWLDSQDYNLFQTDERAGYWAFLDPIEVNSMAVDPGVDTSVNSLGYTTYYDGNTAVNFFNGSINVRINDIDADALADDAVRVIATTNAGTVEMTKSGTSGADYATFTGKISMYPSTAATFAVDVEVADGIGNKITDAGQAILTIDNVKPTAPSINYNSGTLTVTESNSTDVEGYYVFQNAVPEVAPTTTSDYLAHFTKADIVAGSYVINAVCADASAVTIADAAGTINAIAIDGATGEFGAGNSSDISSTPFMPIAKSRVVLTDTQSGGDIIASTGGVDYNISCVSTNGTGTDQNMYALQMTAYEPEVKIAFPKVLEATVPYTDAQLVNVNYISIDGTEAGIVAQVKFRDEYDGEEFFIQVNDGSTVTTYGGTFDNTQWDNSVAPMNVGGNEKTGVTF